MFLTQNSEIPRRAELKAQHSFIRYHLFKNQLLPIKQDRIRPDKATGERYLWIRAGWITASWATVQRVFITPPMGVMHASCLTNTPFFSESSHRWTDKAKIPTGQLRMMLRWIQKYFIHPSHLFITSDAHLFKQPCHLVEVLCQWVEKNELQLF